MSKCLGCGIELQNINNLYIVKDFLEGYKLIKTLDVDVLLIANDRHKTYLK